MGTRTVNGTMSRYAPTVTREAVLAAARDIAASGVEVTGALVSRALNAPHGTVQVHLGALRREGLVAPGHPGGVARAGSWRWKQARGLVAEPRSPKGPRPSDDCLEVTCWCEAEVVLVPIDEWRRGLTRSCGVPSCEAVS